MEEVAETSGRSAPPATSGAPLTVRMRSDSLRAWVMIGASVVGLIGVSFLLVTSGSVFASQGLSLRFLANLGVSAFVLFAIGLSLRYAWHALKEWDVVVGKDTIALYRRGASPDGRSNQSDRAASPVGNISPPRAPSVIRVIDWKGTTVVIAPPTKPSPGPGPTKVRVFVRPSTRPIFGVPRDPVFDLDSRAAETMLETAIRSGATILVWNEVEPLVAARLGPGLARSDRFPRYLQLTPVVTGN